MGNWKKKSTLFALSMAMVVPLTGCGQQVEAKKIVADKVYINGNIKTMDATDTSAEAIAVKNGKTIAIGSNKSIKKYVEKNKTRVVDLEDKLVLPGFIDAHAHPLEGALKQTYEVDFSNDTTFEDYKNTINAYLEKHPDAKFIRGRGWQNPAFNEVGGKPTKEILDAIVKDIPVAFNDLGGHMIWANSKTISMMDQEKMKQPEYAQYIPKNANGEPTGIFAEDSMSLVMALYPTYTTQEGVDAWDTYQKQASSVGITGAFDAATFIPANAAQSYYEAAKQGKLKMWINKATWVQPTENLDERIKEIKDNREKYTTRLTKFGTAKIFADGAVEAGTAYLSSPYRDPDHADNSGYMVWPDQKVLNETFAKLNKNDITIHVHAIGDAATTHTLDAISYSQKVNGRNDYRNALTHLQLVNPSDITRMKDLNLVAVTQPFWAVKDSYYYDVQLPYLGEERAEKEYPIKSFVDNNIPVASSSDYPVTIPFDPLTAIEIGVTRTVPLYDDMDEKYKLPLWKEEAVSVNEMVKSYTIAGAYANKMEKERGSLEVGKYADFVVLDQDIYKIAPTSISKTSVLRTVFEGEDVFKK